MVFIPMHALKADARANLTGYTTTPPNTWEPKGFNTSGTTTNFGVNTLGWNYTRMLGNVGVGNGSLRALNATGNRVINYTEQYNLAGDVSMAPIDPSRLTTVSVSGVNIEPGATSNISVPEFEEQRASRNRSSPMPDPGLLRGDTGGPNLVQPRSSNEPLPGDYPCTIPCRVISGRNEGLRAAANAAANAPVTVNKAEENKTAGTTPEVSFGSLGSSIPLNDPYHSILLGRPVDDMYYEHPHGIATNAYGRLTGLYLPGGSYANIALRTLGYGY